MKPPPVTIFPMASGDLSLALIGGKARSMARLATAGLPVPAGFFLSTGAYQSFVRANEMQESILQHVAGIRSQLAAASAAASASIQLLFEAATLPDEIATSITQAYSALGDDEPAVAVRSSATAEDLPDLSFAGQHDTHLNVRGGAALIEAIRGCWASLWSARAIGYRESMRIDHGAVAMGVIVQVMVQADVSGILFTANPASGERSELVVNASFGLGEAIVAGQVTPDNYTVDRSSLETTATVTSSKERMLVATDAQGITSIPVPVEKRNDSSLSAESLQELAALSLEVEQLFNRTPQDIEWAIADGKCWLLQARAITNLPPAPLRNVSWDPPAKGAKLIRRQVVENMPEPLSPLFEELYLRVALEQVIDQVMVDFEFPFDASVFVERPMFLTVNGFAYCRGSYRFTWRLLWIMPRILYAYIRILPKLLRTLIADWQEQGLPAYLETIEQWRSIDPATAADEQLLAGMRSLTIADASYWFKVAFILGASKITDGMLNRFLTSRLVPGELTSGVFLRGFPSKTLEAQEALEMIARGIQQDEAIRETVLAAPAGYLLETLEQGPGGHQVVEEIRQYLQRCGHQIYNLDFVQPTQLEDPGPVLLSLKSLVQNDRYNTSARQAKIAQQRDLQVQATLSSLGPLRRWLFRKLLGWAQIYGPYREDALFYMGAAWPTLRSLALELGERLVNVGALIKRDDVFFLQTAELIEGCSARREDPICADLAQQACQRRELREARKQLHPPGMVPEKSKFKFGPFDFSAFETQKRNAADSHTLNGFAVSPGKVTGQASVILSPTDFGKMKPDTILVCQTTTPAWTPLFSQAAGLATDIGGILAHGSIVAREYGIPAVMGTGNITRRIVSGQRITVDGDRGTVTIEA